MKNHRVLVTGSAGAVGRAVCRALLDRGHFVRGFDLRPSPHVSEDRVGSIHKRSDIDAAMQSIDTLIHLAAEPNDCDFMTRLLPSNFIAVYDVMGSAHEHLVKRAVLASSVQVVSGHRLWEFERDIRLEQGTAPTNYYAVSKVYAEAVGQMYALKHGMSVIGVRIGWLPRTQPDAQRMENRKAQSIFLSHDDAGRFFTACVEAKHAGYDSLFATSRNTTGRGGLDLEPAKRVIGYEPQDEFPNGLRFE